MQNDHTQDNVESVGSPAAGTTGGAVPKDLSPEADYARQSEWTTASKNSTGQVSANYPLVCTFAAIALLGFGLSLLQNLVLAQRNVILLFDARHYLESSRLLLLFWQELIQHGAAASLQVIKTTPHFREYLMLDGPVLPFFGAFVFGLSGAPAVPTNWHLLAAAQAVLHGLTSLCVAGLTFRIGRDLLSANTRPLVLALAAGMIWALYPGALCASGRFLTEPLAAFLFTCACWLAVQLPQIKGKSQHLSCALACGVLCASLLLLRPVLVPAWGGALLLAFIFNRARIVPALAGVGVGFAVAMAPWLYLTNAMTGAPRMMPERVVTYNMSKGCDVYTDGWTRMPSAPLTNMFNEGDSPLAVARAVWCAHPLESLSLQTRKLTRLWSGPWNEYRSAQLGLSFVGQLALHRLIWLLALLGAAGIWCRIVASVQSSAIGSSASDKKVAAVSGTVTIWMVLAHLAYIPFEAMSRYGFTAMPAVVVLAACGLAFMAQRHTNLASLAFLIAAGAAVVLAAGNFTSCIMAIGFSFPQALIAIACLRVILVVLAAIMLLGFTGNELATADAGDEDESPADTRKQAAPAKFAFVWMPIVVLSLLLSAGVVSDSLDAKNYIEWRCPLRPTESITRNCSLHLPAKPAKAWVLIDGDRGVEAADITVNGHDCSHMPVPMLDADAEYYQLHNIIKTYAYEHGVSLASMRQWRVAAIDPRFIKDNGANEIVLTAGPGGATVYGEYDTGARHQLLSVNGFSPGKICNDTEDYEGRLYESPATLVPPEGCSLHILPDGTATDDTPADVPLELSDLSPAYGQQEGRYRLFLALATPNAPVPTETGTPGDTGAPSRTGSVAEQKFDLPARMFDPWMRTNVSGDACLAATKLTWQAARTHAVTVKLKQPLHSPIRITVTGQTMSPTRKARASVLVTFGNGGAGSNKNDGSYPAFNMVLPETPSSLPAGRIWQDFEISGVVPANFIKGGLSEISVALLPGYWDQVSEYGNADRKLVLFRQLSVSARPVDLPIIDSRRLSVY